MLLAFSKEHLFWPCFWSEVFRWLSSTSLLSCVGLCPTTTVTTSASCVCVCVWCVHTCACVTSFCRRNRSVPCPRSVRVHDGVSTPLSLSFHSLPMACLSRLAPGTQTRVLRHGGNSECEQPPPVSFLGICQPLNLPSHSTPDGWHMAPFWRHISISIYAPSNCDITILIRTPSLLVSHTPFILTPPPHPPHTPMGSCDLTVAATWLTWTRGLVLGLHSALPGAAYAL